ncbi:AB hydrolase-1 domain-containing protein [Mycena kentingensis (nom. inval.)]|nr:AB hydrolase-1 domain-containing protein [Mycena kentingensis (nom. inval.)]
MYLYAIFRHTPMSSYAFVKARPPIKPLSAYSNLLPIFPPLESALPNPLPDPPQPRPFADPRFRVSTHIVPACFLHTSAPPSTPPPPAPSTDASKDDRRRAMQARWEWVKAQDTPSGRYERVLMSVVNRYVAVDEQRREGGKTLFLAHANGFPKETWEPTILELLAASGSDDIGEIWAWEATHHGASSVLNRQCGAPITGVGWSEDARDIVNFLLNFLPSEIAPPDALPLLLPRIAPTESALRRVRGYNQRTLHAVGHSFGGCCSTWAALIVPRVFASLTLVDPVIIAYSNPSSPVGQPTLAEGALARRDTWPSREAALASFKANRFFASWDPRVLDAYVAHGIVPDATGTGTGVCLAMPPLQESLVFNATYMSGTVWDLVRTLDPRIPIRYVVPGLPGAPEIGGPGTTQERVWLRPENSSNVRILTAGHLIVQEAPKELAKEIAAMVSGQVNPQARL